MLKKKIKKCITLLLLILTILPSFANIAMASTEVTSARILEGEDCGYHLQFFDTNQNAWSYLVASFIYYEQGGVQYPAYCLNRDLPGVGGIHQGSSYDVNVDEVMQDVRLWRVAINSYPYQTPESMGLENKLDAYMATKQSIYSILYGWNPETYYKGGDERGIAIKNAIIRLVNIGRNGSQTPNNTEVTAAKIGGFVKDGDYYSQEYVVNSPVDMSQYTVIASNGLPSGGKITNMSNVEKTTFGENEHFKVRIHKSQMTDDINVTVVLRAKCKTYPVFYGKSSIPGRQDYMLTFDPYGDIAGMTTLNVNTGTGKIKIIKRDAETYNTISGVTFQLLKRDGTVVANSTTNSNGEAYFSNLHQDTYVLKELTTNDNYVLSENTFEIDVKYNETTTKTIVNNHKSGDLKIYKVDKDNNKVTLGNVEFDLYSEEFKRVIGTYKTDINGEIKVNNLRTGNYKLIEKDTGRWYNLASDVEFKIEWNKENKVTIENELKKGQVKIIKIDKDNKEIKLEGVEFEVLDENNKVLEKVITNEKGEALTSRYPIRDYSKLKIRESNTLDTYELSSDVKTIILEENQIKTITFENEKKKAQIKVIKVDLDNNKVKLENVKFDVKDNNGNIVDTLITDKNGEAITKRLPIDKKYTIVEKETKKEYVLTTEMQTVTLKQNEIKNVTFQNEKRKGQLKVIKVDKDNNQILLEGITFKVLDENKNIVDTLITDKNGEAITKRLPIDQKYTIVETKTKTEYVLSEETKIVELKENEITSIKFENEKIKGYVEITKIDSETEEKLQDAVFGIYDIDNKEVGKLVTDKNGKAKSELLSIGKYYLKELDTGSVYYLLNENTYKFEIVKNHEVVPITIENDGVDIEVTVDKEGTSEIKPGEKVEYSFSNVGNASNVDLENFKWFDYIPTDYIRLEKMTTGIWNQDLNYDVYYKTNKSDGYLAFKNCLSTLQNNELDFTTLDLEEDEYIIETMFDFGKVDIGFKEEIGPTMECKSLDILENNDIFTNYTKTVGVYHGITAESNSKWNTIVHKPEEKHEPTLPKTGK